MELCNWEVSGLCQHGWSDTAPTVHHRLLYPWILSLTIHLLIGFICSYDFFFTDFLFWAVGIRKTINQCLLKESYFKKFFVQPFSTFHWLSLNPTDFLLVWRYASKVFFPGVTKDSMENNFLWFTKAGLCGFLFLHLQMSLTDPNYTFSSPFLPRIR